MFIVMKKINHLKKGVEKIHKRKKQEFFGNFNDPFMKWFNQ